MVILETERLILREYTPEDFDALYEILSSPVTMAHYPRPYNEKGVHRWIDWSLENYEKLGFGWWALISKETGALLGDCGVTLQNINGQLLPEIGYHIHHPYWRQGYGKEAATAVRDWAFTHTEYDTLYSYMTDGNAASWRLAQAIGMEQIGAYEDEEDGLLRIYAITKEKWAST